MLYSYSFQFPNCVADLLDINLRNLVNKKTVINIVFDLLVECSKIESHRNTRIFAR